MAYTKNRTIDYNPSGTTVRNGVLYCDLNIDDLVSNLNTHEALTTGCHGVSTAGVIVGTTDTQTLTNKTLSSPVLTGTVTASGATITGGTIANVTLASPTLTGTVTASSATITGTTLSNPTITGTVGASGGTIQSPTITGATITNSTIDSSNTFPTSSESTAGIAEIATQAEVNGGADDARIVTPEKLLNAPMIYRKNLIINGGMQVVQRGNLSLSGTPAYGAVDRWLMYSDQSGMTGSGTYATGLANLSSGQDLAVTGLTCTNSNSLCFEQRIESKVGAKIRYALTAGKKLSLQFKIYHNLGSTQDVTVSLRTANSADVFSSVTTRYSSSGLTAANDEWTTIKLEGISPTNTDFEKGVALYISITTPSGMSSKAVYLGDVQLEIGDACTDFELVNYGAELALCQRYYEKSYSIGTTPGTATTSGCVYDVPYYGNEVRGCRFKVTKRTAPTVTLYSPISGTSGVIYSGGADRTASAGYIGDGGFGYITGSSFGSSTTYHWVASAEL